MLFEVPADSYGVAESVQSGARQGEIRTRQQMGRYRPPVRQVERRATAPEYNLHLA